MLNAPIPASLTAMTKRNIQMFFRDRMAVFFSLMGALIIVGLYAFILRGSFIDGLPSFPGLNMELAAHTSDLWLIGGLMAIVPVTTTGGALGILVSDRYSGKIKDFNASPISSYSLTGGYVISTLIVGSLMSLVTLLFCEIYVVLIGGSLITAVQFFQVLGLLIISVLSSTSIMFFLTSLIWSEGGFSGLSLTVGVISGFISGVYVPLGVLPNSVAAICVMFPITHSAALFRDIMGGSSTIEMFSGAPLDSIETYRADMGYDLFLGDWMFPPWSSVAILVVSAIVFFLLATFIMNRRARS